MHQLFLSIIESFLVNSIHLIDDVSPDKDSHVAEALQHRREPVGPLKVVILLLDEIDVEEGSLEGCHPLCEVVAGVTGGQEVLTD